ncbi:MAG: hypothetical protein J5817_02495 [Treponema sp.]|nr:hypothetical protein [Treponema sp.]
MKKNIIFGFVLSILFLGCATEANFSKPYYISNTQVSIGENPGICKFACVAFNFYNNSERKIKNVKFSARVYDSEGESAGLITNGIKCNIECPIESKDEVPITISLDEIIGPEIDESYSVDFLYATEIEYADGTSWADPFGLYCN